MTEKTWDERWREKTGDPLPPADRWLQKQKEHLSGGVALDLACGRGRNSLFLMRAGYQVYAVDSSPAALELLSAAASNSTGLHPIQFDLEMGLPPQPQQADLILCSFFLQRDLFTQIKERIRPGGLFIARSFCQTSVAPESPIIYQPNELHGLFSTWQILDYEEGMESSSRGGTLAGIIARKPHC